MQNKLLTHLRKIIFLVLALTSCHTAPSLQSPPQIHNTIIPQLTTVTAVASQTPSSLEKLEERTQLLFDLPASEIVAFLEEIQTYVRTDNKEMLATLVHYPISIHSVSSNTTVIENETEFINSYDDIATPQWKAVILDQQPYTLFTNWQGVMIHRGELWFGPICLDDTCQETKIYIYGITSDTAQ